MMIKNTGFTLIELLVVITIIGILAVGLIQVYTTQMQKARDSNRIKDIKVLASGVEQFTLDNGIHYNTNLAMLDANANDSNLVNLFRNAMLTYIPNIKDIYDVRHGKSCANSNGTTIVCTYMYRSGITGYKILTRFESMTNVCANLGDCYATQDGGTYGNEFEIWTERTLTTNNLSATNQGINIIP